MINMIKLIINMIKKQYDIESNKPFINIINGGAHSNNSLDIQEFMIVPLIASTFQKSLMISYDIFIKLSHLVFSKRNLIVILIVYTKQYYLSIGIYSFITKK